LRYTRSVVSTEREADVGADVEHRDLDRRDLALDVGDERLHVDFLARVGAEAVRLAARLADRGDERLELLAGAPGDAGDEALRARSGGRSRRRSNRRRRSRAPISVRSLPSPDNRQRNNCA
jgi:hypothetical protein